MQVTPTMNLVWQATGQTLQSMCDVSPSPGWAILPAVDQAGFVVDTSTGWTNWSYNIQVSYQNIDGSVGSFVGVIQVFQYQTTVFLINVGGNLVAPANYPIGGIALNGVVATWSALPSNLGISDRSAAYMVQADNLIYIWSGSAWPPSGQGIAIKGQTAHWFQGSGAPGTIAGQVTGDMYLDRSSPTNGDVYQLVSGTWTLVGNIKGPSAPNATSGVPGLIQLAGDLGGTYSAPTVPNKAGIAQSSALAMVLGD